MLKSRIYINDNLIFLNINKKLTILEGLLFLGIYIPFFCYNKYLNIAGNCRMCLIELNNQNKPIISCLNIFLDNIKIYTNSYRLKKYRENVMEFLLINHPLDCPICDQGGECDLQEQSLMFGSDKSRFFFNKRSNMDTNLNKYIKLVLNRCILCLRCVRFMHEYDNYNKNDIFDNLGVIGRGLFSKISLYKNTNFLNIINSSNIIDLCPVGALTLKVNTFTIRPWEIISILSIDLLDVFSSPIKIDYKNNKIIRILPVMDSIFFLEFISDNTRFNFNFFENKYFLKLFTNYNEIYIDLLDLEAEEDFGFPIINFYNEIFISNKYVIDFFNKLMFNFKICFLDIKIYLNIISKFIFSLEFLTFSKFYFLNLDLYNNSFKFYTYFLLKNKTYKNIFFFFNEDLKILNYNVIFNINNSFKSKFFIFYNEIVQFLNINNSFFFFKNLNFLTYYFELEKIYKFKYSRFNLIDITSVIYDNINLEDENLRLLYELDHSWNGVDFYIYNFYIFCNIKLFNSNFFNILGQSNILNFSLINLQNITNFKLIKEFIFFSFFFKKRII